MATVLIASLGDSPVVVTAMFDLLRKEKNVDQLKVFYTISELPLEGYEKLIYKSLGSVCEGIALDADDVSSKEASYDFLRQLYQQLSKHQKNGDTVYLSLAGGRKSMASLMAFLTPFFPCIKGLYHLLDKDKGGKRDHFLSVRRLLVLPTEEDKHRHLFPSHDRVTLISIPYGEQQHLSPEVNSLLYNITDENKLEKLREQSEEDAEMVEFYSPLTQGSDKGGLLTVELTENAVKQYKDLLKRDEKRGRKFTACFRQMRYADRLMGGLRTNKEFGAHGTYFYKPLNLTFHFYKSHEHTTERAVYHTEPQDIAATSAAYIKKVVISELEFEVSGRYRDLKEIVSSPKFSLKGRISFDRNFPKESGSQEHILIIPLGTSPMVATQLYQLYQDRGTIVHSIILVHTRHKDVRNSVDIACDAFAGVGIDCKPVLLEGWDDIDTPEACEAYQELLEATIRDTRQRNPSCQIELTISGGRKGMAALATFAARKLGIRHVVHTIIYDTIIDEVDEKSFSERVYEGTTIEELKKLERKGNKQERDKRLFLEKYKDDKDAFVLFNIPVLPV
jgi:CRISPR-associated Csx14 family protein